MKTGFVLEGGAMRGMYTVGVLDTFMENNITADCLVGASAGALFGVNFVSGQKGRAIRYSKRYNGERNYVGIVPLLREGNIVSTQNAYYNVPHKLDPFDDEHYMQSGIPFYAVITNIETGEPEYVQIKSVFEQMDTLRASASMPFVSKPVEINGKRYLDGAVADSIPVRWIADQGYEKRIVILTRDMAYRKKPMPAAAVRFCYRKYPAFKERLLRRHIMYNETVEMLKKWEADGKAFVIRPSEPIEIHRLEKDPDRLQAVYDLGVRDGKQCLTDLRAYLNRDI